MFTNESKAKGSKKGAVLDGGRRRRKPRGTQSPSRGAEAQERRRKGKQKKRKKAVKQSEI